MARFTASFPLSRLALSTAAALAAISLSPGSAQAYVVTVGGTQYDVTTFTGSYDDDPSQFATPANNGVMPWWGDSSAATAFATALGGSLGYPNNNNSSSPYFAWSLQSDGPDVKVLAAQQFDLAQDIYCPDGSTKICDTRVRPGSSSVWSQATVYSAAGAPGPLPLFGAAAAFGYSRQLRKRVKSTPGGLASSLPLA